jgi:hypothetical protein
MVSFPPHAAEVIPAILFFLLLLLIAWVFIARLTEIRDLLSDALRRLLARRRHKNRSANKHHSADHYHASAFTARVNEAERIVLPQHVRGQGNESRLQLEPLSRYGHRPLPAS